MIKINENEERVLRLLAENSSTHGEYCVAFKNIADNEADIKLVRRACRSLRKKGLAEFYRGLMNEDGEVAGSGYCISPLGVEWVDTKDAVVPLPL